MKLLCIKNSFSYNKKDQIVKKGNYYNVIGVIIAENNSIWYKLLETGPLVHNSSVFDIPEIYKKEKFELIPSNIY